VAQAARHRDDLGDLAVDLGLAPAHGEVPPHAAALLGGVR
jgi:hypothetical protein